MQRTRFVSIDPEFPRDAGKNSRTIIYSPGPGAAWSAARAEGAPAEGVPPAHEERGLSPEWSGFEALFRRSCGEIRSVCQRFARPGLAVVACHPRFGVTGKVCIAAKAETINATVVGRHRQAELYLSEDPGLALRHLVVITHRLDSAGLFSVLDLRTGSGFVDEEDEHREAVTCDGPVFIRCGDYALFLVPTAAGRALPRDAATAWQELPPRRLAPASFGAVRSPRPRLPWDGAGRVEPPGTFTSVSYRRAPRPADGAAGGLLQPGEPLRGTLGITGPRGAARLPVGATALGEGVLLGRYPRCDLAMVLDDTVSRVHALIIEVGGTLYAVDCASTHHLLVRSEARRVVPLGPGASMELGNTKVDWIPAH